MNFRLTDPFSSPQRMSQSVVQASQMLGLVRAEVGRILGFRCEQFSALFDGYNVLKQGTDAYQRGEQFVQFYQALYDAMDGDEMRMHNWLRRHNKTLGNSPFYLIVDEGKLQAVLDHLLQLKG